MSEAGSEPEEKKSLYSIEDDKEIHNRGKKKNGDLNKTGLEKIILEKKITLLNGVGIITGSIIGSGIFVSPTGVLKSIGSVGASLIVWIACGIYSLLGAYCYAELGTSIHRSGADYAYVLEAFGSFIAFLRLWVEVIVVRPCSAAIVSLTFAKYMIHPIFHGQEEPQNALRLLAVICLLTLAFINCYSVRLSTIVQDAFTYAKVSALVMIIITGFVQMYRGRLDAFDDPFDGTDTNLGKIAMAFYSGLFAYNGWNYLNYVIEEMKNPRRDLPIAIVISCVLVTVVYVLANVAYFTTVTPTEILHSPAVAITFATRLYGSMWWIMPVFVALSTFGGVNGNLLTTSRMFFVAAQENHMPGFLAMVQTTRFTPVPSVIFTCLVSMVYLCFTDLYVLINYMGFVTWFAIALSIFILVYFRWKRPNMHRPLKVPLVFPIIYLLFSAFLLIFAFVGGPMESLMGCVIILTGIPFYWVCVMWKRKPKAVQSKIDAFTRTLQKIFMVVPSDKDDEDEPLKEHT